MIKTLLNFNTGKIGVSIFIFCCLAVGNVLHGQSFVNPSFETWGVVNSCEVNIPPDNWPNYTNGGLGPDEANFNICPTSIPPNASDGNVYARCYAQDGTAGEGMFQNIAGFLPGDSCTISYDYAGSSLYGGNKDSQWHLFIDDIDVDQSPVFHSTDNFWTNHTYGFVATAATHKIGFRLYTVIPGSGTGSGAIDNLSMVAGIKPVSNFVSSDTAFCDETGKCLNFFDHSANNPRSWQWLFPGAQPDTSTQQNPTGICYFIPGTYVVTLIVTNNVGADTLTVSPMIILGSAPVAPTITQVGNDTLVCSNAYSYQWYYNGVPVTGATNSTYIATNDGTYNVFISDSIGCGRLGNGYLFTSIKELNGGSRLSIYPNPATDELFVRSNHLFGNCTISNALGELILTEIENRNDLLVIRIKDLSAGIYFVRVESEKGSFTGKFVKTSSGNH